MAKKPAAGSGKRKVPKGPAQAESQTKPWNWQSNGPGNFSGQKNSSSKFTGSRIEKKRG